MAGGQNLTKLFKNGLMTTLVFCHTMGGRNLKSEK